MQIEKPFKILNIYEKIESTFSNQALSTGCLLMDDFFQKGLPVYQMIEIAGEAGSGKSQLLMQLGLTNLKQNNFRKKILLISIKKKTSLERLIQLSSKLK